MQIQSLMPFSVLQALPGGTSAGVSANATDLAGNKAFMVAQVAKPAPPDKPSKINKHSLRCFLHSPLPGVGGDTSLNDVFDLDPRDRDLTFLFDYKGYTPQHTFRATAKVGEQHISVPMLDSGGNWGVEQMQQDLIGWVQKMEDGLSRDAESGMLYTHHITWAKSMAKQQDTSLNIPTLDFIMTKKSIGNPLAIALDTSKISERIGSNGKAMMTIEAEHWETKSSGSSGTVQLQLELTLKNGVWSDVKCLNN